jgi:hypothetical protein
MVKTRRLKTHRTLVAGAVVAATAFAGIGAGQSGAAAASAAHRGPGGDLPADAPVTVVATGLDSPRALAWGPDHQLLISEAGSPPFTAPSECNGPTTTVGYDLSCFGLTGSISDVSSGTPDRFVTGLPSIVEEQDMVGPDGLSYVDGQLYTLETGAPQMVPSWVTPALAAKVGDKLGALIDVTGRGERVVANVGEVDYQWAVDHPGLVDPPAAQPNNYPAANPYSLTPKPGGGFYVVDAASNTLDSVSLSGRIRILAFIPNTPVGTNAVPTCVAVGPDGAVYIGDVTGHGNTNQDSANIFKYTPGNGKLTVWQSDLSAVMGCGFGGNGDFYVTEMDTTGFLPPGDPDGVVIQISKNNGTRTVLGAGQLFAPSGFLAGPDGSVYVVENTFWWPAGTTGNQSGGEVVKIG